MFKDKNSVYLKLIDTLSKTAKDPDSADAKVILEALKKDKTYCEMCLKALKDVESASLSPSQYEAAYNFIQGKLEDKQFSLLKEVDETMKRGGRVGVTPVENPEKLKNDYVEMLARFSDLEDSGKAKDDAQYQAIMKAFKENPGDFSATVVKLVGNVDTETVSRTKFEKAINFLNKKSEEKGFEPLKEVLSSRPSRKTL